MNLLYSAHKSLSATGAIYETLLITLNIKNETLLTSYSTCPYNETDYLSIPYDESMLMGTCELSKLSDN